MVVAWRAVSDFGGGGVVGVVAADGRNVVGGVWTLMKGGFWFVCSRTGPEIIRTKCIWAIRLKILQ